jgi:hypothetical protein
MATFTSSAPHGTLQQSDGDQTRNRGVVFPAISLSLSNSPFTSTGSSVAHIRDFDAHSRERDGATRSRSRRSAPTNRIGSIKTPPREFND